LLTLVEAVLPLKDGLGPDRWIGRNPLDDLFGNLVLEQPFDTPQQFVLVNADKGYGGSLPLCTACTPDSVHIVFRNIGQFKVHHMRQLVDIEPSSRNIGCNQHTNLAVLEIGQRARSCALALVAMYRRRTDPIALQLPGKPVGTVLGSGEHEHLPPIFGVDEK
jgi:hypothetical protein